MGSTTPKPVIQRLGGATVTIRHRDDPVAEQQRADAIEAHAARKAEIVGAARALRQIHLHQKVRLTRPEQAALATLHTALGRIAAELAAEAPR